jgi:hypothetical protein
MDLQIAIIGRQARLPTSDLKISIFHELIEFLHRSRWISKSPPSIAPFSIVEKSPHTQRIGRCIE